MKILLGDDIYFKDVDKIVYEGKDSDNLLSYRWYDASRVVGEKTMADHFKFACAYWHSFNGVGEDHFGSATHFYKWHTKTTVLERARAKMDAAFEFMSKMQLPYYCFHDVDLVDHTDDLSQNESNLH